MAKVLLSFGAIGGRSVTDFPFATALQAGLVAQQVAYVLGIPNNVTVVNANNPEIHMQFDGHFVSLKRVSEIDADHSPCGYRGGEHFPDGVPVVGVFRAMNIDAADTFENIPRFLLKGAAQQDHKHDSLATRK